MPRLSYGGIDVMAPGVSPGSVLGRIAPRGTTPPEPVDAPTPGMAPVTALLVLTGGLIALSYFGATRDGVTLFGINLFTFLFTILWIVVGLATLKLLVARWPIPGLTEVIAII